MGKYLENNLLNLIENWWWMSCLWTTFSVLLSMSISLFHLMDFALSEG